MPTNPSSPAFHAATPPGAMAPVDPASGVSFDAVALLARLPVAVFQLLHSARGTWTVPFATPELQHLLATGTAALQRDATLALAGVNAADRAHLKQQLAQSQQSGRPWKARFQLAARVRDDHPAAPARWLEASAVPQTTFGGGTLWHGIVSDVTAEQNAAHAQAELHARWGAAALAAGLGVVEVDMAAATVTLDAIACAHHGIDAEQTRLPLRQWLGLFAEADRLVAHTCLSSAPPEGFSDTLLLHRSAAEPAATGTLEFMFRGGTAAQRFVGTCRDVTPQQLLEALRRDQLAAEKAERSKNEFISRVSHELRTPLNGILGFAQLMALDTEQSLSPTHRGRLDMLQQSAQRLMGLIDQLLDLGRMEQGRVSLRQQPVDAAPLIDQCAAALYPLAQARGVEVSVEAARDAAPLRADPHALEQVLHNLLSNAIKYNRRPGRVRVRFKAAEEGVLVVDDTGFGMNEQQLAMLFEPFNRLGAERGDVRGSGLGLVITRQLVQAMGGTLEAFSQVGKGSRFIVTLPLARQARAWAAPAERAAAAGANAGFGTAFGTSFEMPLPERSTPPAEEFPSKWDSGEPKVVLYIEDDEVNTILMEQIFVSLPDCRLVTAASGAEGLVAAAHELPSLILLDLNMPGMSGYDVLLRLKADPRTRHIRCIALSAEALPDQIKHALDTGFDDYWTKPINIENILTRLRKECQSEYRS